MRGQQAEQPTATSFVNKESRQMNVSKTPTRHRRVWLAISAASVALLAGAVGAAPAMAEFGINNFDVTFSNQDGTPATQAGSHPFILDTHFQINNTEVSPFKWEVDEEVKDNLFEQVAGLIGDATAIPQCSNADFYGTSVYTHCSVSSQVGLVAPSIVYPFIWGAYPVFVLTSPPGEPVRLGFSVLGVNVVIDVGVKQAPGYGVVARQFNLPQIIQIYGAALQLWGNPADPAHDLFRGSGAECGFGVHLPNFGFEIDVNEVEFLPSAKSCPVPVKSQRPFRTLPGSCTGPALTKYEMDSWQNPGVWVGGSALTHDFAEPANPQGFTGCGKLGFAPRIESTATTESAETGTGFDFNVDFDQEGLTSTTGLAQSEAKKTEVTLPEGVTINPSVGEGLGDCTPTDIQRDTISSAPGEGCPNPSKVGTLHVDTPLINEGIDGSVFLAQQDDPTTTAHGAENPFDSLIALYMVLRNPNQGALIKLPLKVEPDPKTGRLVATLEDVPQIPFSHFNFHFKEGARAALVTPSACGTYTTEAKFYPWADPANPRTVTSSFEVTKGIGGGPCPSGGIPPFHPHFEAGAVHNNAGSFSPFNMRLIRADGEQEITKFSSILPPGELGSLAGVSKCPDSAIAIAKAKTGRQEIASPSFSANSLIGHTLAGAGVGEALTYVGGEVYLGGPFHGDPLSVISVTPAVAGPFDAGTVVVRLALTLNPRTAEVEVDGANSDSIPHILKGIVL